MWKEDSQMIRLVFRSTLQLLLIFNNEILEAKTEVDVVYMDFRKALDSVSHNGLLEKPNSIETTGKLRLWLREYLQHHFQCVRISDSMSNLCKVYTLRSTTGQCIRALTFCHLHQRLPRCIKSVIPFILLMIQSA